jgi:hypothetical protein
VPGLQQHRFQHRGIWRNAQIDMLTGRPTRLSVQEMAPRSLPSRWTLDREIRYGERKVGT